MASHLTIDQRIQVVVKMAQLQSVTLVQRAWRKEYQEEPPSDHTLTSIYSKFLSTGTVHDAPRTGRPKTSDVHEEEIRQHFESTPVSSIRQATGQLGLSYSCIQRTLKTLKLHPYRIQLVQELHETDFPARRVMCEELINMFSEDKQMLANICFSDEATFHVGGCVHKHNCRIWGYENPHVIQEIPLNSPKVNVWMGVLKDRLLGPFFFDENTITSQSYLAMLRSFLLPELGRLHRRSRTIYQQDGAPPHWSLAVRKFLNDNFPQRWIGRDGPIHWAPRSPDLSPLDFFVWGYVKEDVYRHPVQNVDELKVKIQQATSRITKEMLENVYENFLSRLHVCFEHDGGHFQHLL